MVVISLLVCMILVAGPTYGVYGVLLNPLLKAFNLSRAQVSSLSGALFLALGLSAPLDGMAVGPDRSQAGAGGGSLSHRRGVRARQQAHSLGALLIAHLLMGAGVSAACNVTTPYVIANWYGARRGTALGVAFVGLAVGPMSMTILANRLLSAVGWRDGYLILAIPMLAIAVPIQLAFISSRPP